MCVEERGVEAPGRVQSRWSARIFQAGVRSRATPRTLEHVRVLRSFAWVLVYLVVVPVTPLLVKASVASDRPPESDECWFFCFSQQESLLFYAAFYGYVIAPLLVGVAAVTVVFAAFVRRLERVSAHGLAGLGCLLAVIIVFLGWVLRYPDQLDNLDPLIDRLIDLLID